MLNLEEFLSTSISDNNNSDVIDTPEDDVKEEDKLVILKNQITEGKAHLLPGKWTIARLEKASKKSIDRLFNQYKNPPLKQVDKALAFEQGKNIYPTLIDMYAVGIKNLIDNIPLLNKKYQVNVAKLKKNISKDRLFCENLAVKIGTKIIEAGPPVQMGASLTGHTWNAIEPRVEASEDPVNVL